MRRALPRLALVLAATLLTLLVLDRLVALADPWGVGNARRNGRYFAEAVRGVPGPDGRLPELGRLFEHHPHLDLDFGPFRLVTDARGMRIPVDAPPPADEALAVLVLGDSIAFGWGIDERFNWPRLLEREERAADGRPLAVANAGHLRYDTVQEADWLAAHGAALAPDLVLLSFLSNDLSSSHAAVTARLKPSDVGPAGVGQGVDADPFAGRNTTPAWEQSLGAWFPALADLVAQARRRGLAERVAKGDFPTLEQTPGWPEGWPRCEAALDRIAARCDALGAELVVLQTHPPVVPPLADWCARRGVALIDARHRPDEWAEGVVNSAADPHPNARGQRLLARKIAAGLRAAGHLR